MRKTITLAKFVLFSFYFDDNILNNKLKYSNFENDRNRIILQ